MDYTNCPACGGKKSKPYNPAKPGMHSIRVCGHCEAVYGSCYLGDSYTIVQPEWETAEVEEGTERYYDFTCTGSQGQSRRHGWFNPATGRITQTG
jgi:hypothetical protein